MTIRRDEEKYHRGKRTRKPVLRENSVARGRSHSYSYEYDENRKSNDNVSSTGSYRQRAATEHSLSKRLEAARIAAEPSSKSCREPSDTQIDDVSPQHASEKNLSKISENDEDAGGHNDENMDGNGEGAGGNSSDITGHIITPRSTASEGKNMPGRRRTVSLVHDGVENRLAIAEARLKSVLQIQWQTLARQRENSIVLKNFPQVGKRWENVQTKVTAVKNFILQNGGTEFTEVTAVDSQNMFARTIFAKFVSSFDADKALKGIRAKPDFCFSHQEALILRARPGPIRIEAARRATLNEEVVFHTTRRISEYLREKHPDDNIKVIGKTKIIVFNGRAVFAAAVEWRKSVMYAQHVPELIPAEIVGSAAHAAENKLFSELDPETEMKEAQSLFAINRQLLTPRVHLLCLQRAEVSEVVPSWFNDRIAGLGAIVAEDIGDASKVDGKQIGWTMRNI